MTGQELNKKWESITAPKGGGLYARQSISTDCKPDLMIGVTRGGGRCLLLKLKSKLKFDFREEDKENLKTYYNNSSPDNDLVLELKDPFYEDLFLDLVISLYETIKDIDDENQATRMFISTIRYWSDFLRSKRIDFLSDETVQGLYGELVYLENLILTSKSPINEILESWKGPYDANQDFHFTEKNVEVKTKLINGNIINIANEHQLEAEFGKELELAVVSLIKVNELGDTLYQILVRIRDITIERGGSSTIIVDALAEKKLNFTNVAVYDYLKFKPVFIDIYDCSNNTFPKLISSVLENAIQGVTYKIALTSIKPNLLINRIDLK